MTALATTPGNANGRAAPVLVPVLDETAELMHWPDARYSVNVSTRQGTAHIEHHLENAPQLLRLVASGQAAWAAELRCPRSMLNEVHISEASIHSLTVDTPDVTGEVFVVPGIVARQKLDLDASDLDPFAWSRVAEVEVPAGWWLARGAARSVRPLAAALVRFARDNDGHLAPGQMTVQETGDFDSGCFRVTVAQDIHPSLYTSRDLQIAGLIAVCAELPKSSLAEDRANSDNTIADRLRDRFKELGVPDWDDPDYDPALAATALEPFEPANVTPGGEP